MWETIIVVFVLGAVLLLSVRSIYKTLTGKNDGARCGGNCAACSSCPTSKNSTREK
ncbi:MAG: FeoB-associated Cys-rich membrane protein [Kiritimatiellae bacterium]|nr:FeoB-associated Cys-rich membrane protein [Kiritimatiellia bacterium]MDD4735527.1 FeoB-associated Cys-rich membrane protein [Kiritimatiellia bacterium]